MWIAAFVGLLVVGRAVASTPEDEALFRAIQEGDSATIAEHLQAGADIEGEDSSHRTPLIVAAVYEKPEAVEVLLARGAKVNHVPRRGVSTALGAAVSHGNLDIVRLLLQHGADPNLRDASGYAPLDQLEDGESRGGIVTELLAHGARIEKPRRSGRRSIVERSVDACDAQGLAALLKAGAPQEEVPAKALASCPPDLFVEMAAAGFDLNRRDAKGSTVLLEAVTGSDPQPVRQLLILGADPNLAAPNGETPLMRAIPAKEGADHPEMVQALLNRHADLDARDAEGRTVLHHAAAAGVRKTINLLIAAGADPNAPDRNGSTPGDLYWRKAVDSAKSPRKVGAGLRRIYFLLPEEFPECLPPRDRSKQLVLGECVSEMSERSLGVSLSWASKGATLESEGPGEGLTVAEAEWQKKKLRIGRYTLSGESMGGVPDPEVWIAVVPLARRPLLLRVWAPQEYAEEAGWILRGLLGSLHQPSMTEQLFALNLGQMAAGLGCVVGVLALLGAGTLWLLVGLFPKLRPLVRLTSEKRGGRVPPRR